MKTKFKLPKDAKKIMVNDVWLQSYLINGTRVNVWSNNKNKYFTVGTALNHPTKGKTQLFRKFCDKKEVEAILNNPRLHTGKGYYER